VTSRPKYRGILAMKLAYAYLAADVAKWLKENAPKPQKGQNYHQWLTSRYGLKKLVEHIWMLIGISRTCGNMDELRHKMEQMFGKGAFQYDIFMSVPGLGAEAKLLPPSESPRASRYLRLRSAQRIGWRPRGDAPC